MPNAILVLEKPIIAHRVKRQLEFREPRFRDIMEFGDPYTWIPVPAGNYSRRVDDIDVIRKYAERLIAEGDKQGDPTDLLQLGIRDTKKVREIIVGFFRDAEPKEDPPVDAASNTSHESSSSMPASMPEPSMT